MLFDNDDLDATLPDSLVASAQESWLTQDKTGRKVNVEGLPVHSFRTVLGDLATVRRNHIIPGLPGAELLETLTRPTML